MGESRRGQRNANSSETPRLLPDVRLPLVAIVGRPNVGKSSLFNRLVGGRPALVEDVPGVTRDRRYAEAEWCGRKFRIVDTGGLDPAAAKGVIGEGIHRQAGRAMQEADVIVFVTDGRDGVTPVDRDVAQTLRKAKRPVILVVNKIDSAKQEELTGEMYELGLGDVLGLSASHGRGVTDLCDLLLEKLPKLTDEETAALEAQAAPIRIAFVGRPNVGKSSLVNRLLGEERVLVHDMPGTTTDPIDTPFELDGRRYVLVDTAGIRRRARVEEPTEKISVSMALGQIERSDVAILVIDGADGPAEQDAKIAGAIEDAGRAVLIAFNKDDLLGTGRALDQAEKKLKEEIEDIVTFLPFAPIKFVSAKTGHAVTDLVAAATKCYDEAGRRITTSELNRFFGEVCETHPPPTFHGKPVRVYYLTQVAVHPPTFVLWANRPELVHYTYRRFLANQLRTKFGYEGTPIRIIARRRSKGKGDTD